MEYSILGLVIICVIRAYNEISVLKKRVKELEQRVNQLAEKTGNDNLSSEYVSDELRELILNLKKSGKEVEAIKKLRKETGYSLLKAKQFVDKMN